MLVAHTQLRFCSLYRAHDSCHCWRRLLESTQLAKFIRRDARHGNVNAFMRWVERSQPVVRGHRSTWCLGGQLIGKLGLAGKKLMQPRSKDVDGLWSGSHA